MEELGEGGGFALDGVVFEDSLVAVVSEFEELRVVAEEGGEFLAGGGDVAAGDGEAIGALADDVFPGAGFGGEDGGAGCHGFWDGEAVAFIAAEGGDY